jgi:hypothetical protein
MPDYRNALVFEPKGDQYRRAFFRLLGTGNRLLVRADQTSTRHALGGPIVGRLRRFDELSYAEQVRGYFAERVKATRWLDRDAFRTALAAGRLAPELRDRAGEPIAMAATTPITVVVAEPNTVAVQLPKDKFAVEEDAAHELARLGAPARFRRETKEGFVYSVDVSGQSRDAYLQKLEERGFRFQADREEVRAPLADFAVAAAPSLTVGGRPIPWSAVESLQVEAPIAIPHDAWIIVENELPEDFRWTLVVDGLLAVFVVFNAWLLTRAFARRTSAA